MISVTKLVPVVKGLCWHRSNREKKKPHKQTNANKQTNEKIMLQSTGKNLDPAGFMKPLQ